MSKPTFEIIDSMEILVATAESLSDARYAAAKYAPAMVINTKTGKVVCIAE